MPALPQRRSFTLPTRRATSNVALLVFCTVVSALAAGCRGHTDSHAEKDQRLRFGSPAASSSSAQPTQPTVAETRDPAQLRSLALADGKGNVVNVNCVTCHSLATLSALREQNLSVHGERTLTHGPLKCQSCHDPEHNDRLSLVGGDSASMTEALSLCAQCHGPQYRDYRRGSHGGMRGYWDRTVGPRERKHCVECHDPHAPAFRPMNPVLPPQGTSQERH